MQREPQLLVPAKTLGREPFRLQTANPMELSSASGRSAAFALQKSPHAGTVAGTVVRIVAALKLAGRRPRLERRPAVGWITTSRLPVTRVPKATGGAILQHIRQIRMTVGRNQTEKPAEPGGQYQGVRLLWAWGQARISGPRQLNAGLLAHRWPHRGYPPKRRDSARPSKELHGVNLLPGAMMQ